MSIVRSHAQIYIFSLEKQFEATVHVTYDSCYDGKGKKRWTYLRDGDVLQLDKLASRYFLYLQSLVLHMYP
jgi:hypothetical protein